MQKDREADIHPGRNRREYLFLHSGFWKEGQKDQSKSWQRRAVRGSFIDMQNTVRGSFIDVQNTVRGSFIDMQNVRMKECIFKSLAHSGPGLLLLRMRRITTTFQLRNTQALRPLISRTENGGPGDASGSDCSLHIPVVNHRSWHATETRARGTMTRTGSRPVQDTSRKRRLLFWSIIIAIPLVILAATEMLLRTLSSTPSTDLVVHTQIRGRSFQSINRTIGRRYFAQPGIAVRSRRTRSSGPTKLPPSNASSAMGESTMEGFPYEYNATAPSFLQARLQSMLPDDTVEVINLGISAIGGTVVRDLLPEVLACSPDLIVIYVGHNEYYGAFGPASAVAANRTPWLIRLHLTLLRYRTYVLLRDVIGGLGETIHASGNIGEQRSCTRW